MPILTRRHPSVDLRSAAKMADLAIKHEIESFSLEEDMESFYRSKLQRGHKLRLSTSSPTLFSTYLSDEEQASPIHDEYESALSEYASCSESQDELDDLDFDGDDEDVEFSIDEEVDTPLAPITFIASALAIAIPIQCAKPSIVDISILAPMAKRSIPVSRPQSASYATFTRVKAPSPTNVRGSFFGGSPPKDRPVPSRNFSTPLPRMQSLSPPSSLTSGASAASSSSVSLAISTISEGALLIRESDEIQIRQTILAGTEWDNGILESPTPTSWAAYDPFALVAPTLAPTNKTRQSHLDVFEKQPSGWRRLGLKSKLLAAGRKGLRA